MKKNKNNKKEDIKKDESNKEISSHSENLSGEIDNSFDEIKKLADDFSMSDEPIDNEEIISSSEETHKFDNSEDFLDRLGDIAGDQSAAKGLEKEDQNIDRRLDEISNKESDISDLEESEMSSPFTDTQDELDDSDKPLDQTVVFESSDEVESENIFSEDKSNEEFLEKLNSSLENDPDYKKFVKKSGNLDDFKSFEQDVDDSALIEELEQEIDNADQAINPFLSNEDKMEDNEFISNLDNIKRDEYESDQEEPSRQFPDAEEDANLPTESWEDLIESTENKSAGEEVFDFDNEDSFEDFLQKIEDIDIEEDIQPFSLPEHVNPDDSFENEVQPEDNLRVDEMKLLDENQESKESVDSLRKSFIDEFDQTAWESELAKQNEKKWFPRTVETITNWFRSLNLGEKILIILSFLISLAVLVSIILVVTQWNANNKKIASPPPGIEATDADLIYPTGLELPGGWFFFLEKGEIEDNRWEPVNAEWLANTKLRRVVAIPWSNQSEAVIESLTNQHEINLFMNNNDVITYQVEEVMQISRDNVRILSDTEPSLVVILFREDDQERWAVIAKPNQ